MTARRVIFVHPGDLSTPTGGYGYDRRVIAELRDIGWQVDVMALPGDYPFPDAAAIDAARARFEGLDEGALVLVDGLAFGALPQVAHSEADRLCLVALVHHPLADEGGLSAAEATDLFGRERAALAAARAVVTTSRTTAVRLSDDYGVAWDLLVAAPPGTDPVRRGEPAAGVPIILCVGALVRRKGHDVLVDALAAIDHLSWQARFVGPRRDQDWSDRILHQIQGLGLADRITLAGPVADIDAEYRAASIFALASRHEGYGMAFAEALAHGLPVVGCAVGAVPEVVPPQAGSLVPVDDADALAAALGPLVENAELRRTAANASWAAGQHLPRWSETASIISGVLEELRR